MSENSHDSCSPLVVSIAAFPCPHPWCVCYCYRNLKIRNLLCSEISSEIYGFLSQYFQGFSCDFWFLVLSTNLAALYSATKRLLLKKTSRMKPDFSRLFVLSNSRCARLLTAFSWKVKFQISKNTLQNLRLKIDDVKIFISLRILSKDILVCFQPSQTAHDIFLSPIKCDPCHFLKTFGFLGLYFFIGELIHLTFFRVTKTKRKEKRSTQNENDLFEK